MYVTKSEPTASVVGLQKTEVIHTFETPSSFDTPLIAAGSFIEIKI
jgi:hypothetical protein